MKHTRPPLLFLESSFCPHDIRRSKTDCVDGEGVAEESHISVRQIMLQSRVLLEGDPHPELVNLIVQRRYISK